VASLIYHHGESKAGDIVSRLKEKLFLCQQFMRKRKFNNNSQLSIIFTQKLLKYKKKNLIFDHLQL
jgi:hypothetical protein